MSARRWWAWPLVPVYAAVVAAKNGLRAAGWMKAKKLEWPVVSVGSLSAGGAGKTPVVIALAKVLKARGWQVDVLTRGYGREGSGVERVDGSGEARRFGDEPVLIARAAGVEVWVGRERFEAGVAAEGSVAGDAGPYGMTTRKEETGGWVHLLDDGFQHRRLGRVFDIVLVTAEDLDDTLLPAGNLREGFAALRRADAIVIRQEEWKIVKARVREIVGRGVPLWGVLRTLQFPAPLGVLSAGLRPVAFCAVARPEGFQAMLQDAGCGVVETIAFGDHHAYTGAGIEHIIKIAKVLKASGFVTTEKDAVKLTAEMHARLETVGPVVVIALEAEFVNEAAVMSELEEAL